MKSKCGGVMGLVACAVFKTVGRRLRLLRWVRFPHAPATTLGLPSRINALSSVMAILFLSAAAWSILIPAPAAAQIPVPTVPTPGRQGQQPDTVKVPQFRIEPPVSPLGAMWRSLLVPGWGQAILKRRATGAFFVFWEGVTLTMSLKASHQLRYLRLTGSQSVEAKKQEVQDWVVLLVFNHLMAGAEAFVAAQLWDFPAELNATSLPSGDAALGVKLAIP